MKRFMILLIAVIMLAVLPTACTDDENKGESDTPSSEKVFEQHSDAIIENGDGNNSGEHRVFEDQPFEFQQTFEVDPESGENSFSFSHSDEI